MMTPSTPNQKQPMDHFYDPASGVGDRIKLWSIKELAEAKGVTEGDILFYVNNGSIKAKQSPTTSVLLLPSNSHHVFEKLFFDEPVKPTVISEADLQDVYAHATEIKSKNHQSIPVTNIELPNDRARVDYINNIEYKTKTITRKVLPCLWFRKGKKKWQFFLRVKGNRDLSLLQGKTNQPITKNELENVMSMYKNFKTKRAEGLPWNSSNYHVENNRQKINTFNELLGFYRNLPGTSQSKKYQIDRMLGRYFSGEKGERKLKAYCPEQFAKDYLDVPNSKRAKSDRDSVIKLMSAAFGKAEFSNSVEKLDFINLVKNQPRNRSDVTSKVMPKLATYISILEKGIELGHHEMVFNLIIQESTLTRKARSTSQKVSELNLEEFVHEIPAHENKNRKLGRLLMPKQLKHLFKLYLRFLKNQPNVTKTPNGEPKFLFESPIKRGQARANFDDQFNSTRKAVAASIKKSEAPNNEKLIKEITTFTPHRLRDLSDQLLLDVGATPSQKEKAAGRSTNSVARAYEDLSESKIIELKTKKFERIIQQESGYKRVMSCLIDKWNSPC